jgi:ribosome-associated translation inhibitor RaiA
MQININADKTIDRHAGLDDHVQTVVSNALHRFGEQITRVEVHLSDNLGQKSADGDNRCLMEARVTGYQPIAVSDHAATLHQAIGGAADKLKRAIDSALGRLHDKDKRHAADPVPVEVADDDA